MLAFLIRLASAFTTLMGWPVAASSRALRRNGSNGGNCSSSCPIVTVGYCDEVEVANLRPIAAHSSFELDGMKLTGVDGPGLTIKEVLKILYTIGQLYT